MDQHGRHLDPTKSLEDGSPANRMREQDWPKYSVPKLFRHSQQLLQLRPSNTGQKLH